eukprot:5877958-Alexandrium_andersonii.AAC.1
MPLDSEVRLNDELSARKGHGPPRGFRSWGDAPAGADVVQAEGVAGVDELSLIHISEPTRLALI